MLCLGQLDFLLMSQGQLQLDLHYIAECQSIFKSRVVMHLGDELLTLLCFITVKIKS